MFARRLRTEYESGKSTQDIASEVERSSRSVYTLLVEAGTVLRGRRLTTLREPGTRIITTRHQRSMPNLTATERRDLARALREKYERDQMGCIRIAAAANFTPVVVYTLLLEAGTTLRQVPVAPLGSTERAALAQDALALYEDGLTHTVVGRILDCDHDTARRLIVEAGGTLRTRVVFGLSQEDRPQLALLLRASYERGKSLRDLADEYGCRRSSVSCLIKEAGGTIRPPFRRDGLPVRRTGLAGMNVCLLRILLSAPTKEWDLTELHVKLGGAKGGASKRLVRLAQCGLVIVREDPDSPPGRQRVRLWYRISEEARTAIVARGGSVRAIYETVREMAPYKSRTATDRKAARDLRLGQRVLKKGRLVAPLPPERHGLIYTAKEWGCQCGGCRRVARMAAIRD